MSEWITDRLPWSGDSDVMGKVWIFEDNAVYWSDYSLVTHGTPWMPIKQPAPYVKPEPKRWKAKPFESYWFVDGQINENWMRWTDHSENLNRYNNGNCFQTSAQAIEAARRVRETLLNYHKELQNDQMES